MAFINVGLPEVLPICPIHGCDMRVSKVEVDTHFVNVFYDCTHAEADKYVMVYGWSYMETVPATEWERTSMEHFTERLFANASFRNSYVELMQRQNTLFFGLVDKLAYGKKMKWHNIRKEAKAIMSRMGLGHKA